MNGSSAVRLDSLTCRACGHGGADLRLLGCSCVLHAKCTPLSVVVAEGANPHYNGIPSPVTLKSMQCPICRSGAIEGVHLFGMPFDALERAIELRKQCAQAAVKASSNGKDPKKRGRESSGDDAVFQQIQAESSNLLLSHTRSGAGSNDSQNHRTGRWSAEEVAFVDQLVAAFDQGSLPLPHGVKLNEFLGDMLLCKSSRLTKKMKNAKLSSRSFSLHAPYNGMKTHCCATLSALQEKFLASVPSEAMQLELRFNMSKLWRMHFSNLCLQVGYEMLDARDWVASLEEMEQRASEAEELVRRARRRRMGLALRQDIGQQAKPGVYIQGRPARDTAIPMMVSSANVPNGGSHRTVVNFDATGMDSDPFQKASTVSDDSTKHEEDDADFLANVLDLGTSDHMQSKHSDFGDDYLMGLDDLVDPLSHPNPVSKQFGDSGPFLEKVIGYMERENLPFEHADIWVPSFLGNEHNKAADGGDNLRLFHAGHATRSDLEQSVAYKMNEYGIYSTNFSFAPGVGLPGRVYASGLPSWEGGVDDADPTYFERAGGAKVYGVRCALGIPLHTANIGRIVLALYSMTNVPENKMLTSKILADFTKWVPEPKWKLVIDLGPTAVASPPKESAGQHNVQAVATGSKTVTRKIGATTLPTQSTVGRSEEEDRIAGLLGDHMPLASSPDTATFLPHFMSLRLLLLRSPERRTPEEIEMLDIVKKSFRGFSKDNRRSGAELASLLAKDWMYLSISSQSNSKAAEQHKCHVMQPLVQTSSNGTPTTMPTPLRSTISQSLTSHQQLLPLSGLGANDIPHMMHHHHEPPGVPMHHHTTKRSLSDDSVEQMHVVPES